jgi:hypothetical protein
MVSRKEAVEAAGLSAFFIALIYYLMASYFHQAQNEVWTITLALFLCTYLIGYWGMTGKRGG